ncbi:hypothetical protein LPJ78_003284 [Coemansia sp. RSA 989]|nr:surface antigen-domain-containing protein [Coemansia mojavensis]KAJ1740117.1 hypothetical protein LPJ68_004066 [Coemansia sp. RSA 1086]KAJ1752814.1 hypothetical protein LPJ79_000950 [Coemansia sp. RSA 1821]KAJ1864548.1 hypothetical protein LPJ78_003284 [Coemansia sp. RSA 989]KAJ2650623.1 hypothetical protein IWW40_002360 [Coemansia sp. RSA 1250]KAJ2671904.1 hypothetical protein IWW42_003166 [Coemansia sp. RSA 1085]
MATDARFDVPSARKVFGEAINTSAQHNSAGAQRTVDIGKHSIGINRFSISGVSRIRRGFLSTLLEPVFAAQTVAQVAMESREAAGKLKALGIAKDVQVLLDRPENNQEGIDVHFNCQDGSRYAIKTGVNVGDDEGTASVTGRLNNIFGGGESLEANYTRGNKTQAAFQGVLSMPVAADPLKQLEMSASQATLDNRPYSSYDEVRRTLSTAYRASQLGGLSHELRYSASWREICNVGYRASPSLRSEAGHSLKSSMLYTVAYDDRDSHTVPTCGSLLRATTEIAGLLGDVRFAKVQAELQSNQQIADSGFVVSTGLQAGVLWSQGRSPISDRFTLGGLTSVRGFEYRGIGPHDGNDSIGGDIFYAAGISLLTPLPYIRTNALKGHIWANAGQLALLDDRGLLRNRNSVADEVYRFFMRPSAAVGVGLVYRHSMVRVELSCCLPMLATTTDWPKPGLQFGLGVQFL